MCKEEVTVLIDGQDVQVDACIAPIVAALNDIGMPTVASCCGHGIRTGRIVLRSGVELEVHAFSRERAVQHWSDLVTVHDIARMALGSV